MRIASARGYTLSFKACSGATVSTVTSGQLSALNTGTRYVTISVGGNDAGFVSVLTTCAAPGWMTNCDGAINNAQSYINNTLPGRLSTLYSSIRAKAPNAKRSEEHTSELQSLMRISYAVFCLKKNKMTKQP